MPTVITSTWRPGVERTAQERGAQSARLARHLFATATTASPGKEVRVTGIGPRLAAGAPRGVGALVPARVGGPTGDRRSGIRSRGPSSAPRMSAAVVFVAIVLRSSAGQVLLVLAAGARLSAYIGATVGEIGFLRGFWMDGSRRLAWLEDYAASLAATADLPAPTALRTGIRLDRRVVRVSRHLAPGARRRVGARCRRAPSSRSSARTARARRRSSSCSPRCTSRRPAPSSSTTRRSRALLPTTWRARLAGAFQDFFRFEFRARHTVGLGDVPRLDDEPAVQSAVARAGADDVVKRLKAGLDTQLGPTWPDGVDVSFGQWQKLALARGFMRDEPLLLILDEPTAALDAETEHALFERYAAAARARRHRRPDHRPRVAPLLDRPHGRPHRRSRRRTPRRGRHPRGAARAPRPVRSALRHPGGGVPLRTPRP